MASEVDIANLMLARLGDDATVSNLDPPEGSIQAEHCAQFYPIARDTMLEMHNWNFATRRGALAPVTLPPGAGWRYAYAAPSNLIQLFAVIPSDTPNDYTVPFGGADPFGFHCREFISGARYVTRDFALETTDDGNMVVLTDCPDAVCRYIIRVTDTTKFSPLFVDALGWYGASVLAGPIIKGDAGAAEGKRCLQLALTMLTRATTSDARQQQITPMQNVPWIGSR